MFVFLSGAWEGAGARLRLAPRLRPGAAAPCASRTPAGRRSRPVRTRSTTPYGRHSSWNASSSSGVPVSSRTTASGPTSRSRPPSASAVVTSSARRSGAAVHPHEEELPLDRLARDELGHAQDVDELVDLLLDLLERVLRAVDAEGDARHAGALGRADRQRLDVEAAAREHRRDPRQCAGLVLDRDADSVCFTTPSPPRGRCTRACRAPPRRRGSSGSTARRGRRGSRRRLCDRGASASASAGSSSASLSTTIPTPPYASASLA